MIKNYLWRYSWQAALKEAYGIFYLIYRLSGETVRNKRLSIVVIIVKHFET